MKQKNIHSTLADSSYLFLFILFVKYLVIIIRTYVSYSFVQ